MTWNATARRTELNQLRSDWQFRASPSNGVRHRRPVDSLSLSAAARNTGSPRLLFFFPTLILLLLSSISSFLLRLIQSRRKEKKKIKENGPRLSIPTVLSPVQRAISPQSLLVQMMFSILIISHSFSLYFNLE